MATTLLYYPTFKIPGHAWLTDALLYWDQVGSIVPERMEHVLEVPNIRYLTDEGCYRRFEPAAALVDIQGEATFESELRTRLASPAVALALNGDGGGELWDIAFEKITEASWLILKEHGFTSDERFSPSFLRIRRPAAIIYMGLLADRLAHNDKDNYVKPSTDREAYEDLIFRGASLSTSLNGMSLKMLKLLPRAAPDTELRTLLEFKANRKDNLAQFKLLVNEYQVRIASCPDSQTAKLVLEEFKDKLELASNTIHRLMGENRIQPLLGTVRMIFNSGGATWLSSATATALGAPPHGPMIAVCGSLGLLAGAAIELSTYMIESNQRRQLFQDVPCSYLYYASREGITSP